MTEKDTKNIDAVKVQLQDIKNTAEKLLSKMLLIMQQLSNDDNDIVEEATYCVEDETITKEAILKIMRNETEHLIKDARKVNKEIDKFMEAIEKDTVDENVKQYGYLAKVWLGDIYDKEGPDALNELSKELHTTVKKADVDHLIAHVQLHFEKK